MKFTIRTHNRKGSHWLIFAAGHRFLTLELDIDYDLIITYSNYDWPQEKLVKVKVVYFSKLLDFLQNKSNS